MLESESKYVNKLIYFWKKRCNFWVYLTLLFFEMTRANDRGETTSKTVNWCRNRERSHTHQDSADHWPNPQEKRKLLMRWYDTYTYENIAYMTWAICFWRRSCISLQKKTSDMRFAYNIWLPQHSLLVYRKQMNGDNTAKSYNVTFTSALS